MTSFALYTTTFSNNPISKRLPQRTFHRILNILYNEHTSVRTPVPWSSSTTKLTVNFEAIIHHMTLLLDMRKHLSLQVRWDQSVYVPPHNVSNVVTAMKALLKKAEAVSESHKALNSDLLVTQK